MHQGSPSSVWAHSSSKPGRGAVCANALDFSKFLMSPIPSAWCHRQRHRRVPCGVMTLRGHRNDLPVNQKTKPIGCSHKAMLSDRVRRRMRQACRDGRHRCRYALFSEPIALAPAYAQGFPATWPTPGIRVQAAVEDARLGRSRAVYVGRSGVCG